MFGANQRTESETIAANLRQAMAGYARSTESGDVSEAPGLVLVSSGIPYGVFNAALLTPEFRRDAAAVEEAVRVASAHFAKRNLPWSCWTCDEMLAPDLRLRAHSLFARLGLRLVAEHQGMFAEELAAPLRALPEFEIRRVTTEETRRDFVDVASSVFYVPLPVARLVYGSERYWQGSMVGWVGYSGESPVCTAVSLSAAGAAGIYCVATLAEFRGRGYAERITRYALERTTPARTILQSTPAGLLLYERMGYRPGARFAVYVSK